MAYVPDLFSRARERATVETVGGMTLYREGADWRGECPLCFASKGSTSGGAFWANYELTHWMCFGCQDEKPEDVIELEHRMRGEAGQGAREAALRILGMAEPSAEASARRNVVRETSQDAADRERKRLARARLAVTLWRQGLPATGTPVETYLRACGFWGWHLQQALSMVRYHPRAYHSGDPRKPVTAPAMVGLLMTHAGPTGGVHVTYLTADGRAKAELDPPRKRWGPGARRDENGIEHHGAVWLSSPKGMGPVLVGEGIETVIAGGVLYRAECRMVAALDIRSLQGSLLKDSARLVDPEGLSLDPERPAFTWPGVRRVIACIDRDMNTIHLRTLAAPGVRTPFDGVARARLCARMVEAAWRAAGAETVEFAIPPKGMDMRDQLNADAKASITLGSLGAFLAC